MRIRAGDIGVDYSYGRPDPVELARLGYRFACRYLSLTSTQKKVLQPEERDALHAAGLGIVLVFESAAERPLGGASAGQLDGALAARHARLLGYPTSVPLIAAVDIDITARTLPTAFAYVQGFADTCRPYPLGIYGDTDILNAVGARCVLGWLPNARAWSPKTSTRVHVRQHATTTVAGGLVDTNTAIADFDAWGPISQHPDPLPPTPSPEDDDMIPYFIASAPHRGSALLRVGDHVTMVGCASEADADAAAAAFGAKPLSISDQQFDGFADQATWKKP